MLASEGLLIKNKMQKTEHSSYKIVEVDAKNMIRE